MKNTGVIIVNLGTPDSPSPSDVRKYLLEFLTDGRVIDYPWLPRNLLVRGIIVPFRYKNSAKTYREIWDPVTGSPLMHHSMQLLEKVRGQLPPNFDVELAMRYQERPLEPILERFRLEGKEKIIVLPMFPQYASSTTGSIHEEVMRIVRKWQAIPEIHFISDYYDHPGFIRSVAEQTRAHDLGSYDHILFSYHGLPERHMRKSDPTGGHCIAEGYSCCDAISGKNRFCYRAQCMATTRSLVAELGLREGQYSVCFQSRLGKDPWVQPYTSEVIARLAAEGKKRLLVLCPAFVADCLETVYEVSIEYQEEFEEAGGEKIQLVESLNATDAWAKTVIDIIKEA